MAWLAKIETLPLPNPDPASLEPRDFGEWQPIAGWPVRDGAAVLLVRQTPQTGGAGGESPGQA